jgi:hypothetical protein
VARSGGSVASASAAPAFAVAPLPGSAYVLDPADPTQLVPCTPALCPNAEDAPAWLAPSHALAVDTAALLAASTATEPVSGWDGAADVAAVAAAALAAAEAPRAAQVVCLVNRAPYVPSSQLAAGVSGW